MPRIQLLLIEDQPGDIRLVRELLRDTHDIEVHSVDRLAHGLAHLATQATDVILLDLGLPDSDGLDSLHAVTSAAPQVPVVVLTGQDDEATGQEAVRQGAQDYLVKGLMPPRMLTRVLRFAIERKRVEETLRQERDFSQKLIAAMQDGFSILDPRGAHLDVNPAFCQMTGFSREELLDTRPPHPYWPPKEYAAIEQAFQQTQRGEFDNFELTFMRKDGQRFPVIVSPSWIKDQQGHVVSYFSTVKDISVRRLAEAAVRDREARYRAVVETSLDGFWIVDLEGRLLEVNDAYVRRSGYSRDELLTMRVADLEAKEAPADIAAHIERTKSQGGDIFQTLHRAKDGTIWQAEIDSTYWPMNKGCFFLFIQDIAHRKRAEFLLQTRAQLVDMVQADSVDRTLQFALDQAELLTGSGVGFFHFVDPDQEHLTLQTWSRNTLDKMCKAEGQGRHYPVSQAGVWAACLATKQTVIHNDYASLPDKRGLPEGHAPVVRELVVPVVRGGLVVAVMGVGNKTTDYTAEDAEAVETVAAMVTDMVLRKKTQDEFAQFFQLVPDLVCIASTDGYFQRVNAAWEQTLGYTPAELLAMPFVELVHPEDRAATLQELQQLKGEQAITSFVNRYRARDDSYHWLEWRTSPPLDGNRIFAVARDVTERKQLEAGMARSLSLLQATIESTADGLLVVDLQGQVTVCNSHFVELFRIPAELLQRREDHALLAFVVEQFAEPQAFLSRVVELYERPEADSFDTLRFCDGRVVERFSRPQRLDGQVVGRVWSFRDVSERERTVLALAEAKLAAETANQAKSAFLANMSHEIRSPMSAILGFSEILDMSEVCPAEQHEFLGLIRRNGEALLQLINDVLDLSRVEAGQQKVEQVECRLQTTIDESLAVVAVRAAAKGLNLEVAYDHPLPERIRTDPARLRQILVNLLANAVKFTAQGSVCLSVRCLRTAAGNPRLQLSVSDTGIGMSLDTLGVLFQPFMQGDPSVHRRYGGTGLGLAISRSLARALGGDIEVTSELGRGSTFTLTINPGPLPDLRTPASAPALPAARERTVSAQQSPSLQGRVLYADDSPAIQRFVCHMLRRMNLEPESAEDGQTVCEMAERSRAERQPYDLIFMDIQMPILNGYEATRWLRLHGWQGPIVALTANAMSGDRAKCLEAGCDDYLSKPISTEALRQILTKYLRN
ncbi:MAG: PAS domain S-box protein [Planctomycetota bacterium]|nr:PAS domain S-box protein [Planctomycetota bacterium]